jgi:hypothetical protein
VSNFDVVGYTYQADTWCDDAIRTLAIRQAAANGDATAWGDCGSAEDALTTWALLIGLDRDDEKSFDSGDFPKVIREASAHADCTPDDVGPGQCGDRCRHCGTPIGVDGCPNLAPLRLTPPPLAPNLKEARP